MKDLGPDLGFDVYISHRNTNNGDKMNWQRCLLPLPIPLRLSKSSLQPLVAMTSLQQIRLTLWICVLISHCPGVDLIFPSLIWLWSLCRTQLQCGVHPTSSTTRDQLLLRQNSDHLQPILVLNVRPSFQVPPPFSHRFYSYQCVPQHYYYNLPVMIEINLI